MSGPADAAARLSFSEGTLLLSGWSKPAVGKVFGDATWQWDARVTAWRCHADQYARVQEVLVEKAVGTTDEVPRWQPVAWSQIALPELRAEQQAAIAAWQQTGRGLVVMPTGSGKTEVALRIMADSRASTLVVAPIRDLMYQWHRRILRGLGYDAGILGDNTRNIKAVTVTTYDSACIHMPKIGNQFQLIIFDECHHLPSPMRSDAARMSIAPQRLGLTATPERGDGRHVDLETLIGPTVYRLEIGDARGKSLADYQVFRIPVHLQEHEQRRYEDLGKHVREYVYQRRQDDPTFTWEKLCAESNSDARSRAALKAFREKQAIEDRAQEKLRVLEDLFRLHLGSPMIIFAGSNAMAREVSLRFLIPCLLNHCGKKERLEYLEGLRDGVYPAIVANQVLDEGVDIPAVKVAVVIGGLSSTKQAKQRLGRILRKSGSQQAVLYEVVCQDTNEVVRSRKRRGSDAYSGTRHRRL
jgi:superfamily II DNA or RNA helicase